MSKQGTEKSIPGAPSKRKKTTLMAAFIVFNVASVLFVILMEKNDGAVTPLAAVISTIRENLAYFAAGIAMFILFVLSDMFKYTYLIYQGTGTIQPLLGLKVGLIGRFYDNITPSMTGGQPFQVYYLIKNRVPLYVATSIPILSYIVRMYVTYVFVIVFMCIGQIERDPWVFALALISTVGCTALPTVVLIISVKEKLGKKLTAFALKIGCKLKLVRNYEEAERKAMRMISDYQMTTQYIASHKGSIITTVVTSVIEVTALAMMPFYAYMSLGSQGLTLQETLSAYFYNLSAVALSPTPGCAGAAEAVFYSLFGPYVAAGMLFWTIILWRVLCYYLSLLAGGIMMICDFIKNNKEKKLFKLLRLPLEPFKRFSDN